MDYALDTNSISQIYRFYYRSIFPSFWERFYDLVRYGRASSVEEARAELMGRPELGAAVQDLEQLNPDFFSVPTASEQQFMQRIFAVPHFRDLVGRQARLKGTPTADPYLIAKAGVRVGSCVVTEEVFRPNAARIPNVCCYFKIPCINLQQLMEREGWQF